MVDNTIAGSSDPAQDQTEAAGADLVANQETEQQTIEVRLEPTTDSERLLAVQAGGTPRGVTIRVSPTAPGLTGVTADGAATWGGGEGWWARTVALEAAVAGEDITAALKARHADEQAEVAERAAKRQRERTNHEAVEAAGLSWSDTPYQAQYAETPEEAIEATRQQAAQREAGEAAEQALRDERAAEIMALGLPEGYYPYCSADGRTPYQVGIVGGGTVGKYDWYSTPEAAVKAARRHADEQAAKAHRKAERDAWIAEHGSDGLRDRVARGYSCSRRYMEERLDAELPGWTLRKWDDLPDWDLRSRACPTDAALVLEDEAKAAGYEATTQWAVWELTPDTYPEDEERRSGEVVVVEDFHGYLIYHETS